MLDKVISGGQCGVDIAGLRAAKRAGIGTGGAMPKGFRTRKGPRPWYATEFGMIALAEEDYPARTRKNVADADVTVFIGYDLESAGARTTLRAAREWRKEAKTILLPPDFSYPEPSAENGTAIVADLVVWLLTQRPAVVNIAGNRDGHLEAAVEAVLFAVFSCIRSLPENSMSALPRAE